MRVARWSSSKSAPSSSGSSTLRLDLVEQTDLAIEQALVAASEVDVQVADALAQQLGLLLGDRDGHLLHGVERLREVADLVLRLDADRGEALELIRGELATSAQRVDETGKSPFRHLAARRA